MRRLAAKVDDNQPELVKMLRALPGVTIQVLSAVGKGCPDLAAGYRGKTYLFEVKDPSKPPSARKLTPDQLKWHLLWKGHKAVIETLDQALEQLDYQGFEYEAR